MQELVAIYDKKSGTHYEPKFTRNTADYTREFFQLANDDKTQISKFPEDFQLVSLGTFNEDTGALITNRKVIVNATDCKRVSQVKEKKEN